jgi:Plasmid encoded RepA protein
MGALTEAAKSPLSCDQTMLDRMEQIWGREAIDNPRIGFSHYMHTSCFHPIRDPGINYPVWVRKDGKLTLTIRNGVALHPVTGEAVLQGYPYGIWPRRIQALINAQIIRNPGSREIYVGMGFTPYIRKGLRIQMTGGKNGSINRAKDQFMRLNAATFRFFMQDDKQGVMYNPAPMIERCGVYFSGKETFWPMILLISQPYVESLCTGGNAVPIDLDAMMLIEGALEHDFYTWVTRRVFGIRAGAKPVFISWENLKWQFGLGYADMYDFQKEIRGIVKHIKSVVYRDLKIEEVRGGWNLYHSKLAVPGKQFWAGYTEPAVQLGMFDEPVGKTIKIKPRIITPD